MRDTQRPAPTGDLDTPEEIAELVRRFYADVTQDDLLGPMFNEVAHFERWLTLFHETLDLGWTGSNARRARDIADSVARVHSHQLLGHAVTVGSGEHV